MNGAPDLDQAGNASAGTFVGRRAEIAEIESVITGLSAGRAADGFVVVGPPGSGRTALLGQVAAVAESQGWVTANARSGGADAATAIVVAVTAACAELARRRPGATAVRELARLCRELTDRPGGALRKLAIVLGEAADESRCGVLLTVDDAPTDDATLAALDACAGPTRRAMPVLTVAVLLPGADPDEVFARVELAPLTFDDVAELLAHHGSPGDPGRLLAVTGGWPGFAARLAAADPGEWPDDFASLLSSTLSGLRPAERRYLETVAELGPGPVDVVTVARALGDSNRFSPESSTLAAVRQGLVDKGLVHCPTATTVDLAIVGADVVLRRR